MFCIPPTADRALAPAFDEREHARAGHKRNRISGLAGRHLRRISLFHPINSGVGLKQYFDVTNANGTISVTGYFNRYIGVATELATSPARGSTQSNPNCGG